MYDKKRKEITLIEVGITNQDVLAKTEKEKPRKYDLIAMIHECKVKTVPYMMTWEGVVTQI